MTWENRLTFEVSSADPDSSMPVWVDFTLRIRDLIQPLRLAIGRQNDLSESEPSPLDLVLDNADGALTYGNTASPYPWWGPGRKCRMRETVGGSVLDLFTGYLQVPTEVLFTADIEQRVGVAAIDRLGRLASGEPFVSTVAAEIHATAGLQLHYSMSDAGMAAAANSSSTTQPPLARMVQAPSGNPGGVIIPSAAVLVAARHGVGPPADDVVPALFQPTFDSFGFAYLVTASMTTTLQTPVVALAANWITVAGWLHKPPGASTTDGGTAVEVDCANGDFIAVQVGNVSGCYEGVINANGTLLVVQGPQAMVDVSVLVSMSVQLSTGTAQLRVGSALVAGTWGGVAPASLSFTSMAVGIRWFGSIAHAQFYVGSASFGAAHETQRQIGLYGLERQTTGDRIRTIARYAGVPDSELTMVDKGSSIMQAAHLAGLAPLTAMRDAERTEQGLLYVDGRGNLVFKDRRTLYNI